MSITMAFRNLPPKLDIFLQFLNSTIQDAFRFAAGGNFLGTKCLKKKAKNREVDLFTVKHRVITGILTLSRPISLYAMLSCASSTVSSGECKAALFGVLRTREIHSRAVNGLSCAWCVSIATGVPFVLNSFCVTYRPVSGLRHYSTINRAPWARVEALSVRHRITLTFDNPIDFNDHFSKPKDLKKDLPISFDSTTTSILPHPLLDSDSPFTAELSASVTLNSLGNEDKVFKPGILVYHAIHDKNLVTLEENSKENISSGTLLVFKEPSFLLPLPEPPDECLKNVVLNFYQSKKMFPLHVEDTFAFIIWTFLPFFTYTKASPMIFSFQSENFVFDPGIITSHNPVWICQILQEISQKRTRERMSDQEAKEIKAKAREIMPQPSTQIPKVVHKLDIVLAKTQGPDRLVTNMELDGCYGNKGFRAIG
ncbi:hypothetical protein Tco_0092855 [Tanacetum coccineum]